MKYFSSVNQSCVMLKALDNLVLNGKKSNQTWNNNFEENTSGACLWFCFILHHKV